MARRKGKTNFAVSESVKKIMKLDVKCCYTQKYGMSKKGGKFLSISFFSRFIFLN